MLEVSGSGPSCQSVGVVTYEAMTPPVLEVIGSGPDCQSGNRSGDP